MKTVIGLLVLVFSLGVTFTGLSAEATSPESKTELYPADHSDVEADMTVCSVDVVDYDVKEYVCSTEIFGSSNCLNLASFSPGITVDDVGWSLRALCYDITTNRKRTPGLLYRHCCKARDKIRTARIK